MRLIADSCHVALGSLYNYFPSKDDLILATIESVWQDIFRMDKHYTYKSSFPEYVSWIFERVHQCTQAYPNFFTNHSISFANAGKNKAKEAMDNYFKHMKTGMMEVLDNDPCVRIETFASGLTKSNFIDFILSNILTLLVQEKDNCIVLTEVIKRTIYTQ